MRTVLPKSRLIATIILMIVFSLSSYAYDFESDGIYYNILSEEDRTVEVISDWINYKGDIEIPSRVIYSSKTYKVTAIGNYAFSSCSSLTSVTIPNSVTAIGNSAFYGCSSLTSVTIPNSVTAIGESAFYGCRSLTSVVIPNSVTSIGIEAFSACRSMKDINVEPDNGEYSSVDGILYNKNCTTLVCCPGGKITVTIPNSVTAIGNYAFYGCSSLTSVTIPNSVTAIGNRAFEGCGLTSVTIPNSVTAIGKSAFSYCSSLTSVTIPNSVTAIGYRTFYGCSSLTSVTIPNSVTEIGNDAFTDCNKLKTVYMQCEVPIKCGNIFSQLTWQEAILYVPKWTLAAYEKVDPWRNFWNIEEFDYSGVDMISADNSERIHISVKNGILTLDGAESNECVMLYDLQGRLIYSGTSHHIENIVPGYYIVKVGTQATKVSI